MLIEFRKFDNLGTPNYFYQLLKAMSNNNGVGWTIRDAEHFFYNKVVDGRFVFDGCLEVAFFVGLLELHNNNISLPNEITQHLHSVAQFKDKFVELLILSLKQEDEFCNIFSSTNLSYDVIFHTLQINNSAFKFKYSNFKQLLLDFNVIQIHPIKEINKFILNARYKKIFDKIILPVIKKRKLGIEELRKYLEAQQINGEEAEKFVLNYENSRLENTKEVIWVAEYSVSDGYDILSFNDVCSKTNDRFIEVKSYVGNPYFYWTRNEIDIAEVKGENYFLYLVNRDNMANLDYEPMIIPNPYKNILNSDKWSKKIEKYKFELLPK